MWSQTFLIFLLFLFATSFVHGSDAPIELTFNDSNNFTIFKDEVRLVYIKSMNNYAFVIGSASIKFCTENCEFDVELLEKNHVTDKSSSSWYYGFKVVNSLLQLFSVKENERVCKNILSISPFMDTYFNIKLRSTCSYQFQHVHALLTSEVIDHICLICLLLGLALFVLSSRLSKSSLFYYSSGTIIGILASALVLVFILSRYIPKKPVAYSLLLGGWSICGFIFSRLYLDLTRIVINYYLFVIGYIFVTGFCAFSYFYYHGPVSNPRTIDVFRWGLKLLAAVLIYNGTQLPKFSLSIIFSLFIHQGISSNPHNITTKCFKSVGRMSLVRFILNSRLKPQKLLSEDEFVQQGRIETQKALEELKKFCHSPQCSPWKTLATLESPHRSTLFRELTLMKRVTMIFSVKFVFSFIMKIIPTIAQFTTV